jgi:hypothetical protein
MLQSVRQGFESQGIRGWKSGRTVKGSVDGLDILAEEATASGVWVRAAAIRNDADGRAYTFVLVAPQRAQSDVLTEFERIVSTWKWTRP